MTTKGFDRAAQWRATKTTEELSLHGKYMRRCKAHKHSLFTLRAIGHFRFMHLCKRYRKQLGHALTPAEKAWIRSVHAAEIDAAKVGKPWPKKNRDNTIITSQL